MRYFNKSESTKQKQSAPSAALLRESLSVRFGVFFPNGGEGWPERHSSPRSALCLRLIPTILSPEWIRLRLSARLKRLLPGQSSPFHLSNLARLCRLAAPPAGGWGGLAIPPLPLGLILQRLARTSLWWLLSFGPRLECPSAQPLSSFLTRLVNSLNLHLPHAFLRDPPPPHQLPPHPPPPPPPACLPGTVCSL